MSYTLNVYHLLLESVILSIDSVVEEPTTVTFQSSEEAAHYLNNTLPSLLKQLEKESADNLQIAVRMHLDQIEQVLK